MKKQLLLVACLLWAAAAYAQERVYLVRFKDKSNSPFSVAKPEEFLSSRAIARRSRQGIAITERDLPVNKAYLDSLTKAGARVLYPTRWVNGAVVRATAATMTTVNRLSVVQADAGMRLNAAAPKELLPESPEQMRSRHAQVVPDAASARTEENYGTAFTQTQMLGLDKMHNAGFRGENILIAVLDNGFRNVDINTFTRNARILTTYDFVDRHTTVYEDGNGHGAAVFSILAANRDGEMVGSAPGATYALFRTEDDRTESRAEEAYWLAAAERADSLGADIISMSLGYNTFDDATLNYKTTDLDGKTTLITQAAEWASATGMLIVKSAGNEGNSSWRTLTAPADARNVLAVAAVQANGTRWAGSSLGPTADGRRKPDLAAMGAGTAFVNQSGFVTSGNGTSYATPLVSGLAAGLWQAFPNLKNSELADVLRRSGSRATTPNDSIGHGTPHFERAQMLVTDLGAWQADSRWLKVYPNPVKGAWLNIAFEQSPIAPHQLLRLRITDLLGREYYQAEWRKEADQLQIPLSALGIERGMYFLHLSDGHRTYTVRWMYE
jgi:subtilisin family serine protease